MSAQSVLLVAHHCNPEWGSEPLIGWRWASELDRRMRVELITHVRNQEAIERAGGLRGRVHYVNTERLAAGVNRLNKALWGGSSPVNRLALEAIAQRAFDRAACRIAMGRLRASAIRLIHRVSPISPRFPSKLGTLGVPLVLGPVNGGMTTMKGFGGVRRRERDAFVGIRCLARFLDPLSRTFRSAARILIATEVTRGSLPRRFQKQAARLSENAVDLPAYKPVFQRQVTRTGGPLRALYLGRLLPYKGVESALRALAAVSGRANVTLDVVGDGPDRARLEALAFELGVVGRVTFHGSVPVHEVPRRMANCDVYVFPSVRESGGSTVMEAMAAGKPVIVADHGGPAETVPAIAGYKLGARDPDEMAQMLSDALCTLAHDEERRESMGRAARAHVERHYTWSVKVQLAMLIYDQVGAGSFHFGERTARPTRAPVSHRNAHASYG